MPLLQMRTTALKYSDEKEQQVMSGQQLKPIRRARLALVGSIVGACVFMASPAPAVEKGFKCVAHGVAVVPELRIHLRCDPADGDTKFFAFNITHPDANRVLSLLATAVAARRAVHVVYEPTDMSGSAIHCEGDCRLIRSVEMFYD